MIATNVFARACTQRRGLLVLAALALCAAGCVQRRLTIRSNPPGAFVYVDNYPIGTTPVSTDFVYYGKRQIRLVRDGYETLTVEKKIKAPWYEWFGIDFVSENLVPYNIRDEQSLDFQLVPQQIPASPQLQARAEELRASSQAQRYVPPPLLPPAGTVPAGAVPPPQQVPPGMLPPPGVSPAPTMNVPPSGPPPGFAPPIAPGSPLPGPSAPPNLAPPAAGPGFSAPAPNYLPPAANVPPQASAIPTGTPSSTSSDVQWRAPRAQ